MIASGLELRTDEPEDARFQPGRVILGHYTIVSSLGRGGMGTVYLARDDVSGQRVAVKVLPASLARERDIRDRFVEEARALATLDHPGIVPLVTFSAEGDDRFLVMKYVEGEALDARIRARGILEPEEVRGLIHPVLVALGYAPARGITHRDVKPSNVLLTPDGRVVLVDFGIAKKEEGNRRLTQTGMLMGTPQYMSPEQIAGQGVDGRSDLYACGLLLFEMLAGRPPFDGVRTFDVLKAHVEQPIPDVRVVRGALAGSSPVPDDLVALISVLLRKNPAERPTTADDVLDLLDGRRPLPAPGPQPMPPTPIWGQSPPAKHTKPLPAATSSTAAPRALAFAGETPHARAAPLGFAAIVGVVFLIAIGGVALRWHDVTAWLRPAMDAGLPDTADAGDARFLEAHERLEAARAALARNAVDDARIAIEVAAHLMPQDRDVRLLRAEILLASGRPEEAAGALRDLEGELSDDPSRAPRWQRLRAGVDDAAKKKLQVLQADDKQDLQTKDNQDADPKPLPAKTRPRPSELSSDALRAVTAKTRTRVSGCYVDHIQSNRPRAEGEVVLNVTIAPNGRVSDVAVKRSPFKENAFAACLQDAAKRWRFPSFPGKEPDVLVHKFYFRPG